MSPPPRDEFLPASVQSPALGESLDTSPRLLPEPTPLDEEVDGVKQGSLDGQPVPPVPVPLRIDAPELEGGTDLPRSRAHRPDTASLFSVLQLQMHVQSYRMAQLKVVNMRTAQITLSALVRDAQEAPVCLTRHGRPMAVIVGVEGQDLAAVLRQWDPSLARDAPAAPGTGARRRRRPQP